MSRRFLFVGEQPSRTAFDKGWTWKDGRLAAKTLFDALYLCGIDPQQCGFVNGFCDHPGEPDPADVVSRVRCLIAAANAGTKIVALGEKVAELLSGNNIPHRKLRHPAARGAGRAHSVYAAHVKMVLCG